MSPKTTERVGTHRRKRWGDLLTPGRVVVGVLAVLALVFIFQNTQNTEIRLLVTEVTMPLWMALLGTALVGALCGAFFMRRRR
ncbi:lipopolysaccharide assembly protein LapA domain-containing protein [Streptomyces europaeiscabiei]|uniref:LapA family protein n=1 Tax=Streptomyces europaeiscabiei TaxID=146819 RepID=A0ABU4N5P7_9ACTN|nr:MULTISPECIES: LapA family protein [Streptomyces]MDX2526967.1 LapA family protein [Streptomyces europaeiscabiei]MDX2758531.1 LapA family protein [Streptomyces europaeiscabiei]MDX2767265.1 LapA family protein [Streptomyces europaeiscabiei]MDX3542034.1 LapA family protein [Streptomyces europaeiscabiei]MDX3551082.1 LapA family protein [Streptomyces europaeiscabiei]